MYAVLLILKIVCVAAAVTAALYLLMIMPGMRRGAGMAEFQKWYYAHRGLHDNGSGAPENSMPAFEAAVKEGFGIELDIQLSKDKVPVVFHDFTLKRVCGAEGKVSDYTYEELQQFKLLASGERIPRLEDVLGLVAGKVPLIVEFKIEKYDVSLCPAADRLLRDYEGPYCMESFNPLGVRWYGKHHSEICRGQLSDAFLRESAYGLPLGLLYFLLQNLLFNFWTRPDFVAYNRKYPNVLSRKICRGFYKNTAAAWTVRSGEELEQAKKHFDIFIFEGFLPVRHTAQQDMAGSQQDRTQQNIAGS